MLSMIPSMVYAFLILWIIPFYPRYRNAPKASRLHVFLCAACAATLVCICVLVSWRKRNELILMIPLMIVCSYVDARDQEIPDLPLAVVFLYTSLGPHEHHTVSLILMGIIMMPFVITKKIGMGDCKLMGLMLMYAGMHALIGFVIASLLCMVTHIAKKEPSDMRIPFGPYLCAGFLFTLLSAG